MIPHHQQAVELSAMVPDRSTNADSIALAAADLGRAAAGDRAMKVFLVQWNENPDSQLRATAGTAGSTMQGMVDDGHDDASWSR